MNKFKNFIKIIMIIGETILSLLILIFGTFFALAEAIKKNSKY